MIHHIFILDQECVAHHKGHILGNGRRLLPARDLLGCTGRNGQDNLARRTRRFAQKQERDLADGHTDQKTKDNRKQDSFDKKASGHFQPVSSSSKSRSWTTSSTGVSKGNDTRRLPS